MAAWARGEPPERMVMVGSTKDWLNPDGPWVAATVAVTVPSEAVAVMEVPGETAPTGELQARVGDPDGPVGPEDEEVDGVEVSGVGVVDDPGDPRGHSKATAVPPPMRAAESTTVVMTHGRLGAEGGVAVEIVMVSPLGPMALGGFCHWILGVSRADW